MPDIADKKRELIEAGASLDETDAEGLTALQHARNTDHAETIFILEEAEAAAGSDSVGSDAVAAVREEAVEGKAGEFFHSRGGRVHPRG